MSELNEWTYDVFDNILRFVKQFGFPMIVLAWIGVFSLSVVMVFVLKRHSLKKRWIPSLIVGGLSLVAHMFDFVGTISACPDLSYEANPIWLVVVDTMGLRLAHWYGFTGKIILAVLSFELFAYYLIQREDLLPENAAGFFDFWRKFGYRPGSAGRSMIGNMKNLFAFLFALIGPFCFYIALLNSITDADLYLRIPSMPIMLFVYLALLTGGYVLGNYWSFIRRKL